MRLIESGFKTGMVWISGRNQIGFKMSMVQVEFGLSTFGSLRFGFELGRVISGMGNFGSGNNLGFVRLWIGLLRVFGSKSVHPISGVGSGTDPGRSVRVSDFGSVLSGLGSRTPDRPAGPSELEPRGILTLRPRSW